jgi:cell division transport system permease protein
MFFFIRQSLGGLFRNGVASFTSVFILTSCLILMGCFGFFMINVNINLEQLDGLMNTIVFIIDKDFDSEEDIAEITRQIADLHNVKRIEHRTRREALERTLEQIMGIAPDSGLMEDGELISRVMEDEPLPDEIHIEYYDIGDLDTLKFQLASIDGFDRYRCSAENAQFLVELRNVVMAILAWFLIVLFIIAIFIILNTVRLSVHSRKSEITIMRYIGATNFFILFPFLLEGVIIGVVSAAAAYALMRYIYQLAVGTVNSMIAGLALVDFSEVSLLVFVIFVLTGVSCGLIGSSISSQKHLKA